MNYENIPDELKTVKQWICHKDKIPKSPLYNGNASPTDPDTWSSFEQACTALKKYDYSGLGFVFAADSPYCGIDIDHCINSDTGEINENALDIVENMDSYTELSPSKTGLHIIYKGAKHPEWKKKAANALGEGVHLEMYQSGRYFTFTGNKYGDQSCVYERDGFAGLIQKAYMTVKEDFSTKVPPETPKTNMSVHSAADALSDSEIIALARRSNKGFPALYGGDTSSYGNDDSCADSALCAILAFYTKDPAQIDRIFRSSGLMRDKWNRKTGGSTYGAITIEKALKIVKAQYDPGYYKANAGDNNSVALIHKSDKTFEIVIPEFDFENELKYKALNQIETAAFFAEQLQGLALYVPEDKHWMIYNGRYWEEDKENLKLLSIAKDFALNCYKAVPKYIPTPEDASEEEKRAIKEKNRINKEYRDYYYSLTCRVPRENLLKDIRDITHRSAAEFDTDPFLFNCPNGTLDLLAGQIRGHDPKDYITKLSGTVYNPAAKSERFDRFIDEIMQGDKIKARYLQKALGYCLAGDPKEECFFLILGQSTRNGKGTLFDTILSVFGDYGLTIAFDTIARQGARDGSRATPDIARLCGVRLAVANEPDKGVYFNEALLKQLTGGDTVTARELYGRPFEFKPQFRIWITANNKPNVSDNSIFQSSRLKLISFDRHFEDNEQDKSLKATLKQKKVKSAVFNWLLEGYRLYQTEGLKNYSHMNEQLSQYERDSDIMQQFIDDRLIFDDNILKKDAVSVKFIRTEYVVWCRIQNISPLSQRTFKEELSKHGVETFIHHKQEKVLCRIAKNKPIDE